MRTIVRAFMLGLGLLSFHEAVFSQQVAKSISNSTSPDGRIGFLEFRPSDYGSQKHPLIIFLHGIGERGNGSSQINSVTANAIPMYCSKGATMRFTVNGQTSSFVVLSPQLSSQYGYWPPFYVKEMIKYAKANLQIDPNRIYITGLSLGGGGTWRVITDSENWDYTFDAGIAAAAPVCGTQEMNDPNFCSTIGANHLPIWAFHSMDDGTVGVGATQHGEILGQMCNVTPQGKYTYYQSGGHYGAWANAYDTGHITRTLSNGTNFTASPNLYEWFLMNTRGTTTQPTYTAPIANAGSAQTITLPLSVVTLTGSGSGTNGATISSYSWAKTSGPSGGTISLPLLNTTLVTGLVQGTYVFTLTVTDNHGLTSTSTVTITVNALFNQTPTAKAGSDITITLPTSSVTLNGSASSDPDGNIAAYRWTQTTGPAGAAMSNRDAATTNVTGLVAGSYTYVLEVTDNGGLKGYAAVIITVNSAPAGRPAPNQAPEAIPGAGATLTLPTNSFTLTGTASKDADGSIVAYRWTQTLGPDGAVMATRDAANTYVTGLVAGSYTFILEVTDNEGLKGYGSVILNVNPPATNAFNQTPLANAGANITTTLPASSVTLNGSASWDPDGNIAAYRWTQTVGPDGATMTSRDAVSTTVNGLVAGNYTFILEVTDNGGLKGYAGINITVNPAAPTGSGQPIGYIKLSGGPGLACDDASSSGRTPIYASNIANGNLVYLDAANTQLFNGGWNWYSFTPALGGSVTAAFAVYPNGAIALLTTCSGTTTPVTPPVTPPVTGTPLGYVKISVGPTQACADASTSDRLAVYGSGIANGGLLYLDAAKTKLFDGGWNWYSFTPTLGATVTQAFAVYPNGGIALLTNCSGTPPVTQAAPPAPASTLLGYIKISTGPSQACDDASTAGRMAIYGTSVANGSSVYTDAAMTQKYDGGWNWYSFTPALGGSTTAAFAIYPIGTIGLMQSCGSGSARIMVTESAPASGNAEAMLQRMKDSVRTASAVLLQTKLVLYPNPVHTTATIELSSAENSTKTVNLYNASGILKATYRWQTIKGHNVFQLKNVAGLANGFYIIDITDSNGKSASKLKFIKM